MRPYKLNIIEHIKLDAFRYGASSAKSIIKLYVSTPGFRFMCWHRIAHSVRSKGKLMYFFPWFILKRLKYKYGYDIPAETKIEAGFYIGHFGGIVISSKAVIGKNVNISQGVTIGLNPRGRNKGYPTIGDNVYIGAGAKIIGNILIGDNSAIGANAVVTDSIPENGVAVGIPAKVISTKGSEGYILNKV